MCLILIKQQKTKSLTALHRRSFVALIRNKGSLILTVKTTLFYLHLIIQFYSRLLTEYFRFALKKKWSYGPLIIVLNNRDYNIDQNNRDYDFCHNQAALLYLSSHKNPRSEDALTPLLYFVGVRLRQMCNCVIGSRPCQSNTDSAGMPRLQTLVTRPRCFESS